MINAIFSAMLGVVSTSVIMLQHFLKVLKHYLLTGLRERPNVKLIKFISKTSLTACFIALLPGTAQVSADHKSAASIAARIAPVGSICIQGQSCQSAVGVVANDPITVAARSGADIYNAACAGCHNTGAAGAPKLGDVGAWKLRADKGLESLLATAISGINAMPAWGLCMDCSESELRDTIQYILNNSK
jgi:cytochrome c5